MTKAAVNHVYTTAKEDAGMGMDVDFVIFAQQNRSERSRVDNITCSEHSKENVPKHKYKDKSMEPPGLKSRIFQSLLGSKLDL